MVMTEDVPDMHKSSEKGIVFQTLKDSGEALSSAQQVMTFFSGFYMLTVGRTFSDKTQTDLH